ncbi:TPA: PTS fructose transporter subunit IIC [Streptococcus pyogenes]|uniref:PTS fructose transporter subunit IIC n=1 Tax=Streptococcus pyogenes TaxID=1314 RepID=UPI00064095F2|nr:PTS fructose transporter subunit IIC [Streptococcus pyogenes]HER4536357.1 PTS fructose transporter subunit IIC [Streptococcus pyogenes NGAS757]HER4587745.1 PTS fructose transporter subunit IIC [Streptococcus pyogenes NGAS615]HER4596233.1 PTS fructose transporter subunit IIC [Streptococcus pyogenes NGAS613]HER4603090.1 PTS fructose transporter subunit IIC [Streptococcus pyogenes NGAS608]HER4606242.1 PTS fructose transporter subunit IIC [Streptococcus pyogenes NGAS609]HER4609660.1 PTS fructo
MDIIIGTSLLILVLAIFSLFNYKAPHGAKAMGALASAACASFLVEAFQDSFFGKVLGFQFLSEVGGANGSLSGVAAAILVAIAIGVSPGYAVLIGLSVSGTGIIPGFVAGYVVSFLIKWMEKNIPGGLDLISIIIVGAPLTRFLAQLITPVINSTLLTIGDILTSSANSNPIIMGMILGGTIVVVATAPLSSMALTAMLGLTGIPMAIGALSVFGSSFMNGVLFYRLKLGERKDNIAFAIEPLTQADVTSANPIPIYVTNFVGGGACGVLIALMKLVNDTPGTATPIAGFAVMFAYNPVAKVLITALGCIIISLIVGYIGGSVFKNYRLVTKQELQARN